MVEVSGSGCAPAGPQKGRVQEVWSVGGSDHKHILSAVKTIQLGQELRHHPASEDMEPECPWPFPSLCPACGAPPRQAFPKGPPTQLGPVYPSMHAPCSQCPPPNPTAPFSLFHYFGTGMAGKLWAL